MKRLIGNRLKIASGQRDDMPIEKMKAYREKWAQEGYELPPWNPSLPNRRKRVATAARAATRNARNLFRQASAEVIAARLQTCNACPLLRESDRRCSSCSCYVDIKTKLAAEACPEGYWLAAAAEVPRRKKHAVAVPHVPGTATPYSDTSTRHLIYHIYPVSGNGVWQWNVRELLKRIDLFNGVRSIAVLTEGRPHSRSRGAVGRGTSVALDPVSGVQALFEGHRIDNWIVKGNDPKKREVQTRRDLMRTLPDHGVTFSGHAKGVTFNPPSPTVTQWTEMLYRASLDVDRMVLGQLESHYMTGPFKVRQRFGQSQWHYSGSFYWFRNHPAILASPIPGRWFGTEEWPGTTVSDEGSACTFGENIGVGGQLYREPIYETLADDFNRWERSCGMGCLEQWVERMRAIRQPTILKTGAKVWEGSVNKDYESLVPDARWVGTDISAGEGVDLVGDLHELDMCTNEKFDGILCPATLEHVEMPWIAMASMANRLKDQGWLLVITHQTFPLHGYPQDYYRFSTEALKSLVSMAGLEWYEAGYQHPCKIVPTPAVSVWNDAAESYLNVSILARKQ